MVCKLKKSIYSLKHASSEFRLIEWKVCDHKMKIKFMILIFIMLLLDIDRGHNPYI